MTTPILANANACRIPLADESVDCVVTSPPYWSLRKYDGQQERIWGGDKDCRHSWGETRIIAIGNAPSKKSTLTTNAGQGPLPGNKYHASQAGTASAGRYCSKCSAWKGALGLEPSPSEFVSHLVEVFREVRRVLKPSGTVWVNIGDGYASQPQSDRHADPKATRRTPDNRCRTASLKAKDLCLIPARLSIALQEDGWYVRSEITWCKVAPMPESCQDRPTTATEKVLLMTKEPRYYYDAEAVRARPADYKRKGGRAMSKAARAGIGNNGRGSDTLHQMSATGHNLWNYWILSPENYCGSHFAVFPTALPDICIRAGSSEYGCCAECGRPWERVTTKEFVPQADVSAERGIRGASGQKSMDASSGWGGTARGTTNATTTGWRPPCACYRTRNKRKRARQDAEMAAVAAAQELLDLEYVQLPEWERAKRVIDHLAPITWQSRVTTSNAPTVPAVVCDPFCGSGSTLIAARRLGRQGIGLDLSFPYLRDQARPRLELDRLDDWGQGREAETELDGLPLFARRGAT